MQAITMYRAADGSKFDTAEACQAHERKLAAVRDAMGDLPGLTEEETRRLANGAAFKQHDPEAVTATQQRLLDLARPDFEWVANSKPWPFKPGIYFGWDWLARCVSEADGPLAEAWGRMQRIDPAGREWEQPYFVNPETCDQHATKVQAI